jgi:hypothetical protein
MEFEMAMIHFEWIFLVYLIQVVYLVWRVWEFFSLFLAITLD